MRIGDRKDSFDNSAHAGWLICDGSAVDRTTYAGLNTLASNLGYPWGSGDGSTTFNVPLISSVTVGNVTTYTFISIATTST